MKGKYNYAVWYEIVLFNAKNYAFHEKKNAVHFVTDIFSEIFLFVSMVRNLNFYLILNFFL